MFKFSNLYTDILKENESYRGMYVLNTFKSLLDDCKNNSSDLNYTFRNGVKKYLINFGFGKNFKNNKILAKTYSIITKRLSEHDIKELDKFLLDKPDVTYEDIYFSVFLETLDSNSNNEYRIHLYDILYNNLYEKTNIVFDLNELSGVVKFKINKMCSYIFYYISYRYMDKFSDLFTETIDVDCVKLPNKEQIYIPNNTSINN